MGIAFWGRKIDPRKEDESCRKWPSQTGIPVGANNKTSTFSGQWADEM